MTRKLFLGFFLLILVLSGATVPSGFNDAVVAAGLSTPTAMAIAPDGRIFVCEQGGALRVIKNGALLPAPFVVLAVDSLGERGLLGIAFDPNFATNQHVFVYHTPTNSPRRNRITRFTANGDIAVAGSGILIFELDNLSNATNHNGGAMHFGPDGKLYVGVGENATPSFAQTLTILHGKMLRINSDGTIPTDNPFFNTASGKNRAIWALGLRNPFTFAIQPGTARMFINDVGAQTFEEINDGIAGSNYGWPTTEGPTSNPNFRSPVFWYGRGNTSTTGCAITGGTFYNPVTAQFPAQYVGKYFFADYCTGWIRTLDPSTFAAADFASGIGAPVDLQAGSDGTLYYLSRGSGAVHKITYPANQAPQITSHPANRTVTAGASATFTVSATGSAPLSYQWQRNGVNIAGATSASYTLNGATTSESGTQFRAIVSNGFGSASSNPATLTVTNNQAPTAAIVAPGAGTLYSGGQPFNYSGSGNDAEDGALPASAFTWRVDFHHDTHIHPFIPARTGSKTGSFTVPNSGHTETNVWYRIHLTVRDSQGLTRSVFRDVLPRVVTVTLQSSPTGAQLKLDGQPVTAPYSFQGVVGIVRTIEAVGANFISWSDGGARAHNISTPAANTTYTATYGGGGGGSNVLANPGFEAGVQGWQKQTFGGRSVVTTQAHSGTRSQQIITSNAFEREVFQVVAATAGRAYAVSAWIKTSGLTSAATVTLIWTNSSDAVLRTDTAGSLNGTQGWLQRSAAFTAPAGAVSVRVRLLLPVEADNAGTVWFDDVSLIPQ